MLTGKLPLGSKPYLALSGTSMAAPVVSGTGTNKGKLQGIVAAPNDLANYKEMLGMVDPLNERLQEATYQGEQRLLEPAVARHAAVVGVRENRASDPLGISLLAQDFATAEGVICRRRPALVIEIMQERHDAPGLLVFAKLARVAGD